MELSLAQIEQAIATLRIHGSISENTPVRGWSIDSRSIHPGDLFFAIKGQHFDGHVFLPAVFEAGAAAAVVSEPVVNPGGPVLQVRDTIEALQQLARRVRQEWSKPIIAITGSAGKTSTKDIIGALLSVRFAVAKTAGNLNNHIGLPLTLLRLPPGADLAVVEMGMNHAGEIRALAAIAQPQVGVVTNVGCAHIEAFSSVDEIAAAKRELIEMLPPDGVAVLNADDQRVLDFRRIYTGTVVTYGVSPEAGLQAKNIATGTDWSTFTVAGVDFKTKLAGHHAISNILAGLAVARLFEIPLEKLIDIVAELAPGKMRGERLQLRGAIILNDSYNSNPEAARSMIDVLMKEKAERKIAVLGEMLELGRWAEPLHRDLGRYAAENGVDVLIGVGGASQWMIEESIKSGLQSDAARFFEDSESAGIFLRDFVQPGDAVLFKGSRGTHVERALAKMEE
jgi:UDP-N-acetylmuramoyl-tripeptide--D-alanyl-D-alanine ligase